MSARARHRSRVAQRGFTPFENALLFAVKLSPAARLLYVGLKHYSWKLDGDIPSQAELAIALGKGFSERTIREAFKELERARLLTVERREGERSIVWIEEPVELSTTPANIAGGGAAIFSGVPRQNLPGSTRTREEGGQDLSQEVALADARARSEAVDAVYGALVEECYPDGAALTDREKRKVALAARNIASAAGGEADVRRVAAVYRKHPVYGACAVTALALSDHFAELLAAAPAAACAECGVGSGLHNADCPVVVHKVA